MVDYNYQNWIQFSSEILKEDLVSIYKIGTYGTTAFTTKSDIDLIYVMRKKSGPSTKKAFHYFMTEWSLKLPLDIHFITLDELKLDISLPDAFFITSCLAWQGTCEFGEILKFPYPDERQTLDFHAMRLLRGFEKSVEREDFGVNAGLFRAIEVLNKNVSWKNASSKISINSPMPSSWNLAEAKDETQKKIKTWEISEDLRKKLSLFLKIDI